MKTKYLLQILIFASVLVFGGCGEHGNSESTAQSGSGKICRSNRSLADSELEPAVKKCEASLGPASECSKIFPGCLANTSGGIKQCAIDKSHFQTMGSTSTCLKIKDESTCNSTEYHGVKKFCTWQ